MTGAEYIGRVAEVARKHGATVNETTRGANIICPGGALVELYIDTYRSLCSPYGVVHEPGVALRGVRWADLDCLVEIKRLVASLPNRVDGPAPTYAPTPSRSGFGSGAFDDTKNT